MPPKYFIIWSKIIEINGFKIYVDSNHDKPM